MSDDQAAKVIQFPGKMKDVASAASPVASTVAEAPPAPAAKPRRAVAQARSAASLGLLAVILATVAVNRFAYRSHAVDGARGLASANLTLDRDAAWEKSLAERLAKPGSISTLAQVGRRPTLAEDLRFAALEDKYVIALRPDAREIAAISPSENSSRDALIVDRAQFLKKYGQLFDAAFARADLKSVERADGKVTEAYELLDQAGRAKVRAIFELDGQNHLLAVRTVQI